MKYPIFKRYDKNVDPVDGETFTDDMVQVLDFLLISKVYKSTNEVL